ncbi:AAA family ATPase [Bifidobacterium sp. ESL0745]|uniref:AAA family ATPase n=1 Tax=Bifidobacterium sp. ESL0745 TaxID=2983226 RepID=UPI0023F9C442|nr:AAA family ATPase [Bifidobacterium sp. ESL0745]MDF7665631.1 AAA family ATPase [Bifidobacterium sp. ESL0745]
MLLCTHCRHWNGEDFRFCEHCGDELLTRDDIYRKAEYIPMQEETPTFYVSPTEDDALRNLPDAVEQAKQYHDDHKDGPMPVIVLDPGAYAVQKTLTITFPVLIMGAPGCSPDEVGIEADYIDDNQDIRFVSAVKGDDGGDTDIAGMLGQGSDTKMHAKGHAIYKNLTFEIQFEGAGIIDSCIVEDTVLVTGGFLYVMNSRLRESVKLRNIGWLRMSGSTAEKGIVVCKPDEDEAPCFLGVFGHSLVSGTSESWGVQASYCMAVVISESEVRDGMFLEKTFLIMGHSKVTGDPNSYGGTPMIIDKEAAEPDFLTYMPKDFPTEFKSIEFDGLAFDASDLYAQADLSGSPEDQTDQKSVEELLAELDALTGLGSVKDYVRKQVQLIQFQQRRKTQGLSDNSISHNMIFAGNPGTGKTTVARIYGKLLHGLGIVGKSVFVEASRSDFVAGYTGQTALKTKEVIDSARGGVLFIDEAYTLVHNDGSGDDFGHEAVETLLKAMEDYRDDMVFILAGYTDEMEQFLNANAGLKSRIPHWLAFEDYTPDELVAITKSFADREGYVFGDGVGAKLKDYFASARNEEHFGNARSARNIYEVAITNKAAREMEKGEDGDLTTLISEDFGV